MDDQCLNIDDLPQMLYQLTIIGNKLDLLDEVAPEISNQILNCISFCMDTLLLIYLENTGAARVKVENTCLTICHHLSLTVSKDQSLCRQILKDFKSLKVASRSSFLSDYVRSADRDNVIEGRIVSPAMLMFAFLVAKSQRQEDKISAMLLEVIESIHSLNERAESSIWYQESMWKIDVIFSSDSFKLAFDLLFKSPLMFEPIIR
jgi:hypothetical protein